MRRRAFVEVIAGVGGFILLGWLVGLDLRSCSP
jgi:hypothetical protein